VREVIVMREHLRQCESCAERFETARPQAPVD
jgi:hypothetical protein